MGLILPAVLLLGAGSLPAGASDRDCYARLKLAEGAGFIKGYKPISRRLATAGLDVTVAEAIWNGLALPSKQGMIRNLNCALLRQGRVFAQIRVRSDLTGGIIAEARGNDLVVP